MTHELIIHAPIDGWVCALDEVPDAAFAGRMVGEGLAIDPTGMMVRAPFDGVVTTRSVEVGDLVRADGGGTPLLSMDRDDVLRISVNVPQNAAVGVRPTRCSLVLISRGTPTRMGFVPEFAPRRAGRGRG